MFPLSAIQALSFKAFFRSLRQEEEDEEEEMGKCGGEE